MKNALCFRLAFVFISLFLFNSVSEGQPTTWAQPGAHWIYKIGDDSQMSSTGFVEVIRIGDTISNGINCDILSIHYMFQQNWPFGGWQDYYDLNRYTYKNADTVYISNDTLFQVLFAGNTQPGGYWLSGNDYYNSCGGDTIFIDNSQVVTINGVSMNLLSPEVFDWQDPEHPSIYYHHPIFERFGSTGYFFPLPACIICPSWGPLICYTDGSGFFYSPDTSISCPVGIEEIKSSSHLSISISPNPANNEITVHADKSLIASNEIGEIYNMTGSKVATFVINKKVQQVNISDLSPGSYFIKIKNRPQLKPVSFIKL